MGRLLALLPALTASLALARPNILLLFPDQWRWDWASNLYSVPLHMPTFDALTAVGVRFAQAYVPSPLCAPSRACLASGREYDEAGVPDNFSNDYPLNGAPML
jgi:arylsulfatase